MNKRYQYKVYNTAGNYAGSWEDPVNDFDLTEEINSAGSSVTVELPRGGTNLGIGTDVDLGYEVVVLCVDDDTPNGQTVFDGFISSYQPVTDADGEKLVVTILGWGAQLDNAVVETGSTIMANQETYDNAYPLSISSNKYVIQSFVATNTTSVSAIELMLQFMYNSLGAYDGVGVTLYEVTSGTLGGTCTFRAITDMATAYFSYTDTPQVVKFAFEVKGNITTGKTYFFAAHALYYTTDSSGAQSSTIWYQDAADNYTSGRVFISTDMVTISTPGSKDLWFRVYVTSGAVRSPYLSVDPGSIVTSILDDFNLKGGVVTYTAPSVSGTGTTVSYIFNTNTTLEALKKCAELAPSNWWWRVDQALNVVHFHARPTTPAHTFVLGKHIESFEPTKTTEQIVNTVYLTGGALNPMTSDTFTDTAGHYLDTHTGETRAHWVNHPSTAGSGGSMQITSGGRVRGASSAAVIYYTDVPAQTGNYSVFAGFYVADWTTSDVSIVGRLDLNSLSCFEVKMAPQGNAIALWRWINGTATQLAGRDIGTHPSGQEMTVELRMENDQISVWIDGAQWMHVQDNSNWSFKYAGVRGSAATTDSTGVHLDNYKVVIPTSEENLFRKYQDQTSIDTYGRRVQKYTDARITDFTTADIIGQGIIDRNKDPLWHATVTILDGAYDIESINIGDLIAFRGFGDFRDSLQLQVVRRHYTPDAVTLDLDMLPPQTAKRVEDVKRNLDNQAMQNNPDSPS